MTQQLEIISLRELELEIEIERRRRQKEAESVGFVSTPRDIAFAQAFPFRDYIYQSFPIIEQGREFKNNWHIDALSELLQAVTLGQVRNAIINIPRRTMKSVLVCVMWQTWSWTFLEHTRWIYTSYTQEYAKRDNEKCSQLIKSQWYQDRFGDRVPLTNSKLFIDRRNKIQNTKGGYRAVFKIGSGLGDGGDFVVADDPNDIEKIESQSMLDKTALGWNEVAYHNVVDKRTACRLIVQQRTDENDLTGQIINDPELVRLYEHICLPMEWENDHPHKNSVSKPFRLGFVSQHDVMRNHTLQPGTEKLWIDPRDPDAPEFAKTNSYYADWYKRNFTDKGQTSDGEGQLLWESYMPKDELLKEISHLKNHGYSAQFQQRPIQRGGNFYNTDNFKTISRENFDPNDYDLFVWSWDKAGTEGKGDFTVGVLMARTIQRPFKFVVVDFIKKQVSYKARMELIKTTTENSYNEFASDFQAEFIVRIEREPNSSGKDMAEIEKDELVGYEVETFLPKGKKEFRARPLKLFSEQGKISILEADWNTKFWQDVGKYKPGKKNQDDNTVDAMSGCGIKIFYYRTNNRQGSRSTRR